jgi:predicted O-linked N-acetylglucosamine transferase (SPINDLY family)
MKPILLILSIFSSFSIFGQIVTKEFFKIQTADKNAKTIIFQKQSIDFNESFLIIAFNKSSNDFTKCSWEVELSVDCLKELHQALSEINFDYNSQVIYKNISVKVKKGRVRISFLNSSCLNEHSISYFQKSCNRELSFPIKPEQINSFVQVYDDEFINKIAVK